MKYSYSFTPFLLLLFLTFFPHPNSANSKLIEQSCARTLYTQLCKITLNSSPDSKSANLAGLAKIVLKTASSNATHIHSKLENLLASNKNKALEPMLKDCSEQYADAVEQIEDSLAALDSKGYADVNTWVTAAMSDADSCDDGFQGHDSPLEGMSKIFSQLCSISLTFSNLLANA